MELKEKLVALRKEKGLTQSAVAEKLDVSRQAISRWESGIDQLVSACLSGDESWAEACDDELYHRFVEAPFTVCSYISLIQDDEKIERVCDGISVAEVCWGLDQEIEDIISNMREFSLSSAEAHTVSILENSYQRIVELNK